MKIVFRLGLVGLCLFFTMGSFAQSTPRAALDASRKYEAVAEKLNLSAEQTAAFQQIMSGVKSARNKITADKSLSREDMMTQLKANRADSDRQIAELLNPDQLKVYSEMKANTRGERNMDAKAEVKASDKKARFDEEKARREKLKPQLVKLRKDFDQQIKKKDRKKIAAISKVVADDKAATRKSMGDKGKMDRKAKLSAMNESKERLNGQYEAAGKYAEKYADEIEEFIAANQDVFDQMKENDGKMRMPNKMKEANVKKKMAVKFLLMEME